MLHWRRPLVLCTAALLVLTALAGLRPRHDAPAVFAQAGATQAWSLRVQTPHYNLSAHEISVSGYDRNDVPGAPVLPVWSTTVQLPASGDWEISYQSPAADLITQTVTLPAVAVPMLTPPRPDGWATISAMPDWAPTVDHPDPAIYQVNAFYPRSPIVPGEVQWRQGQRLLALRVFPFQYNPVTHALRYHPDLQITIHVSAEETPLNPPPAGQGCCRRP